MSLAEHFDDLYGQIPDTGCKGLCQEACGPIAMHPYERARIRRAGVDIPLPSDAVTELLTSGSYTCPALMEGRCSVYDLRPLICRLYGAADDLRCEHGCEPAGGLLPGDRARRFLTETILGVGL